MMIGAQISIQIIPAEGPPLIIALKDVRNFETQQRNLRRCPPPSTSALSVQAESTETSVK